LVTKPQSLPYVEAAEESLESSFQALELQDTGKEGAMAMVAKVMSRNGYQEGKGLGTTLQGIVEPIPAIQKIGHCGLGYEEDALVDGRFWMRKILRDQRFDQKMGKMNVTPLGSVVRSAVPVTSVVRTARMLRTTLQYE